MPSYRPVIISIPDRSLAVYAIFHPGHIKVFTENSFTFISIDYRLLPPATGIADLLEDFRIAGSGLTPRS